MLFVLLILTAIARFIVYGTFETSVLAMIFLIPVFVLIMWTMAKQLAKKERAYEPSQINDWSFLHTQNVFRIEKPLFKGLENKGYIKRYFQNNSQYVLSEIFGSQWYLSLEVEIEGILYDIRWYQEKQSFKQDSWKIYKNGLQIGEAKTANPIKNSASSKETIIYHMEDKQFKSKASSIGKTVSLFQEEQLVGTASPHYAVNNVQVIELKVEEPLYIVGLVLHSYYFQNV